VDIDKDLGINADGVTGENEPVESLCSFYLSFINLDDLEAASDIFPAYCRALYSLDTFSNELWNVLDEYVTTDSHYDKLFGYFVKYMKKIIPGALKSFLREGEEYCNIYVRYPIRKSCVAGFYI
jgi:hypothetical protein